MLHTNTVISRTRTLASLTFAVGLFAMVCNALVGCAAQRADVTRAATAEPLYEGDEKTWLHRANSIEKAKEGLKRYPGVELDVVFEGDHFDVRHDRFGQASGLTLGDYFDALSSFEGAYFWLDVKNFHLFNTERAVAHLIQVVRERDLAERVIVESTNVKALAKILEAGLYTSYWVPSYKEYDPAHPEASRAQAEEIAHVLTEHSFHAISSHHGMVPFLAHFFPQLTIHTWAQGVNNDGDRADIEELSSFENVRVILVSSTMP